MTGEIQPASIVIRSERLVAEISPHGAELIRLQDRDGKDLLWNGCEKWWTGRAPLPSALIFDQLKSRAVNFGVPGEPSIRIRFPDLPHLGVWTKPGAGFLCIEPWQGYAAPLGFAGELKNKPGGLLLAANASSKFAIEICLLGANEPSA